MPIEPNNNRRSIKERFFKMPTLTVTKKKTTWPTKLNETIAPQNTQKRSLELNKPNVPSAPKTTVGPMINNALSQTQTTPAAMNKPIKPNGSKYQPVMRQTTTGKQQTINNPSPNGNTQKPEFQQTCSLLEKKVDNFHQKKSISNLSANSNKSKYSTMTTITHVPRHLRRNLTSDANQHRVADNRKIQEFEFVKESLCKLQSTFLRKSESLKDVKTNKHKGPFKLISMVQNQNCQLLVNQEDLMRLPTNIPLGSVRDFKETFSETYASNLNVVDKYTEDLRKNKVETNVYNVCNSIRSKLKSHQDCKLEELMESIDKLCKSPISAEMELQRAVQKMEQSELKFSKLKLEMQKERTSIIADYEASLVELIKNHKNDIAKEKRQAILSAPVKAILNERDKTIESRNDKIKELNKEIEKHKKCINEMKTNMQDVREKEILLNREINTLQQRLRQNKSPLGEFPFKETQDQANQTPDVPLIEKDTEILELSEEIGAFIKELQDKSAQTEFVSLFENYEELLELREKLGRFIGERIDEATQTQNLEEFSLENEKDEGSRPKEKSLISHTEGKDEATQTQMSSGNEKDERSKSKEKSAVSQRAMKDGGTQTQLSSGCEKDERLQSKENSVIFQRDGKDEATQTESELSSETDDHERSLLSKREAIDGSTQTLSTSTSENYAEVFELPEKLKQSENGLNFHLEQDSMQSKKINSTTIVKSVKDKYSHYKDMTTLKSNFSPLNLLATAEDDLSNGSGNEFITLTQNKQGKIAKCQAAFLSLKENNKRCQELRLMQESTIASLDEEIARLQQKQNRFIKKKF